MPHDKNGQVIQAGDEVIVRCKVKEVQPGEEYCNATLEAVETMPPSGSVSTIVLNTKQCEKVDATPAVSDQGDGAGAESTALDA